MVYSLINKDVINKEKKKNPYLCNPKFFKSFLDQN